MAHWLRGKTGEIRSGWKVLGFFLILGLLGFGTRALLRLLNLHVASVWIAVALGALASGICVRLEGRRFCDLGFRGGGRWGVEVLVGALGGLSIILLTALVARGAGGFHWERTVGGSWGATFGALGLWLGVAFNEELIARGYPFQRLVEGAGPWVGQLVFAGLFALGHWGNPGMHGAAKAWATLNIALAAVLLGLAYLRTRSLALPIGIHLGWNWGQGSLLGFGVSGTTMAKGYWTPVFHGKPQWLTGGAFGLEASLPCAVICLLAILGLALWKGRPADSSR